MVIRPTRARHDSFDNNKYNSVPVASHLAHQVLLSDPENVKGLFRAGQLHLRLKNIEAAKVSSRKLSCRQYSVIWILVALLYVHYKQLLCTAVSNNQGCTLFVFFVACHMARQWPWQRVGYHGKPWPWVTSLLTTTGVLLYQVCYYGRVLYIGANLGAQFSRSKACHELLCCYCCLYY